jgi:hypothetical protein
MVLKQEKQFQLTSMYLATLVTILLIVTLTIGGELLPVLKTTLKNIFGHHWVGKSILATVLFLVVHFAFREKVIWDIKRWTILLAIVWILGNLAIFGFYVLHFFIK